MAGVAAFGTQLKRGGTGGTAVANVTTLSGPSAEADVLDVSAHDSPSAFREYVAGMLDAGEISMGLNFDPNEATHADDTGGLWNDFANRTESEWALVFPTTPAVTVVFDAFVRRYEFSSPFDDKLDATVALKVTSNLTWS